MTQFFPGLVQQTATFTETQAAFGFFGYFDTATVAGNRRWNGGDSASWTGYITGATATMRGSTSGAQAFPWWVSVDGGTEVNPQLSVKADGIIPLFTDLTDGPHLVRIRCNQPYSPTNCRTFTTGTLFQAWGAAPAIGLGADLGTYYHVSDPSFPGNSAFLTKAAPGGNVTPTFKPPGPPAGLSSASTNPEQSGCLAFNAKCSSVWLYTGWTHVRWSIDGAAPTLLTLSPGISASATPLTSTRMWKKVPIACDLTTSHTYWVAPSYNQFINAPSQNLGIMIGDSTATYQSIGTLKKGVDFGDSITAGTMADGVTVYGTATGPAPLQLCQQNDSLIACAQVVDGSSNHKPAAVCSMGSPGISTAQTNVDLSLLIAGLNFTPDFINIRLGRNDSAGAALLTQQGNMINALIAAYPSAKIMWRGIYRGAGNAVDANIATSVAAALNANVTYFSTAAYNNLTIEDREEYGQGGSAAGLGPNWPTGLTHPTDSATSGYPAFAANQQTAYNALCT